MDLKSLTSRFSTPPWSRETAQPKRRMRDASKVLRGVDEYISAKLTRGARQGRRSSRSKEVLRAFGVSPPAPTPRSVRPNVYAQRSDGTYAIVLKYGKTFAGFGLYGPDRAYLGTFDYSVKDGVPLLVNSTHPSVYGATPFLYHYRANHTLSSSFQVERDMVLNDKIKTKLYEYGMTLEGEYFVGDTAVVRQRAARELYKHGWQFVVR